MTAGNSAEAELIAEPRRSRRGLIVWGIVISVIIGFLLLIAFTVVPLLHVREVVKEFCNAPLVGQDPSVAAAQARTRTIETLGGAHRAAEELRSYLRSPICTDSETVPILFLLAGCGEHGVPTLISSLREQDPRVRRRAALSLRELRGEAASAVEELAACLRTEEDRGAKLALISAIGSCAAKDGLAEDALAPLLADGDPGFRCASAEALAVSGARRPETARALARLLADAKDSVAAAAGQALEVMGKDAQGCLSLVLAELKCAAPTRRLRAIRVLAATQSANRNLLGALEGSLSDKVARVRSASAEAIGAFGPTAVGCGPALRKALRDDKSIVRVAAAESLWRVTGETMPSVLTLIVEIRDSGSPARLKAIAALGSIGPPAHFAIKDLERLVDQDDEAGQAAREALDKIKKAQQEKQAKDKQPAEAPAK